MRMIDIRLLTKSCLIFRTVAGPTTIVLLKRKFFHEFGKPVPHTNIKHLSSHQNFPFPTCKTICLDPKEAIYSTILQNAENYISDKGQFTTITIMKVLKKMTLKIDFLDV